MTKNNNSKEEPIEKQLWKAADKLRKNIDAAKYKHIVLGLIFLKYISDAFEDLYQKLKGGKDEYAGTNPEVDFNERFTKLKAEFEEQLKEEEKLNKLIIENLEKIELKK